MSLVEETVTLTREEVVQHWKTLRRIDNYEAIASRSPEEFFGKQLMSEEVSTADNRRRHEEGKPLVGIAVHFDNPDHYFKLQEFKMNQLTDLLSALLD